MQFNYSTTLPKEMLFDGLEKLNRPQLWLNGELCDYTNQVECPKCKGHGCWHYSKNTKMSCGMCNGSGWIHEVRLGSLCDHTWKYIATLGRCLKQYECTKCGHIDTVDSSD